jgi:hypothetical protein
MAAGFPSLSVLSVQNRARRIAVVTTCPIPAA